MVQNILSNYLQRLAIFSDKLILLTIENGQSSEGIVINANTERVNKNWFVFLSPVQYYLFTAEIHRKNITLFSVKSKFKLGIIF